MKKVGDIPWSEIFKFFAEKYSWDAEIVANLSLSQLRGYIKDGGEGKEMTSHAEVMSYLRTLRKERGIA